MTSLAQDELGKDAMSIEFLTGELAGKGHLSGDDAVDLNRALMLSLATLPEIHANSKDYTKIYRALDGLENSMRSINDPAARQITAASKVIRYKLHLSGIANPDGSVPPEPPEFKEPQGPSGPSPRPSSPPPAQPSHGKLVSTEEFKSPRRVEAEAIARRTAKVSADAERRMDAIMARRAREAGPDVTITGSGKGGMYGPGGTRG